MSTRSDVSPQGDSKLHNVTTEALKADKAATSAKEKARLAKAQHKAAKKDFKAARDQFKAAKKAARKAAKEAKRAQKILQSCLNRIARHKRKPAKRVVERKPGAKPPKSISAPETKLPSANPAAGNSN